MNSEDGEMGFQIAPMVDVVFVLLLFFMAVVGSQLKEKWLHAEIPAVGHGAITPIYVDISADGTVSVNDKVYGVAADRKLGDLRGWLKEIMTDFGKQDPVVLRPAPDTRQERIIDVLDACAAEKVAKLTFG